MHYDRKEKVKKHRNRRSQSRIMVGGENKLNVDPTNEEKAHMFVGSALKAAPFVMVRLM